MGDYLSTPITEKNSSDEENHKIKIGASSMQGWREGQEDAHNSVLDFDEIASFFAVYDGHGGREVALYCANNLPKFIKNTEAYQAGDFEKALVDGYLGLDSSLTSNEVIEELQLLKDEVKDETDVSDEENVNKLFEEASMPLDQVMKNYLAKPHLKEDAKPLSPCLKAKGKESKSTKSEVGDIAQPSSSTSGSSASSSAVKEDIAENDKINKKDISNTTTDETSTQSTSKGNESKNSPENCVGDTKNTEADDKVASKSATKINDASSTKNDSETPEVDEKPTSVEDKTAPVGEDTKPQENGKVTKKGKVFAKTKGVVKIVRDLRPKRTAKQLYMELLESESESEDEEDKTFQGSQLDSSDEEVPKVVGVSEDTSDSDNTEEDDVDEEDEEDGEDDDSDNEDIDLVKDIPGSSSGCTAVVALIHGNRLYVANAGDSRCIVCRNGKAVDMSIDHKPEDMEEYKRITEAGGRVDWDGRVNGGLNLSRAIGDHAYKLNANLSPREQMITALPDIKTCTLTPADEFMVLACDGIWNSMSSQEVAEFVKCRLDKQPERLSIICEELFDNCLATNTLGDGTGCDNMTAIIVSFKNGLFKRTAPCDAEESSVVKRAKTDDENPIEQVTSV